MTSAPDATRDPRVVASSHLRVRSVLRVALTVLTLGLVYRMLQNSIAADGRTSGGDILAAVTIAPLWALLCLGPPGPRSRYAWIPVVPLIAVAGFALNSSDVPFNVRWHFAREDLADAIPQIIASGGADVPSSVDGIPIIDSLVVGDRAYFVFPGQYGGRGWAYLPNGIPDPEALPRVADLAHDRGNWYTFGLHFGGDPWGVRE